MQIFDFIVLSGAEQAKTLVMVLFSIVLFVIIPYFRNQKSENLEPFNSNLSENEIDFFRNASGSFGETSRVLTQKYYSILYDDMNVDERINHVVDIRVSTFDALANVEFPKKAKKILIKENDHNIPMIITLLCFFEDSIVENFYFEKGFKKDIYRIILEEHNKICPLKNKEFRTFDEEMYNLFKKKIQKYYLVK